MIHRLISNVALVSLAALVAPVNVSVLAATERATFILTDGERKSGPVVFHGDSRENLINGYLNLGADDGKEQTFRVDQVAVIDFVGGRPQRAELQALPADNTHLLVLRSGGTQQGKFINMIGGDTVRWQNQAGEQQQYAIRDVSRIYLNPQSARTVWNFRGTAQSAAVATSGTVLEAGAVRVEGNQPWTDTGVTVKKGDHIAFRSTGQIQFWQATGENAGPDGNDSVRRLDYPVNAMPVGGLIGKVGNGAAFPIGSNAQPIVMPAGGRLMLGVNDNLWSDNSGYFSVVITKS